MSLLDLAVLLGVACLLILAGVATLEIIRRIRQSATPSVQAILDALLPYAYRAIWAGEAFAVAGLDEVDRDLSGADKAAIANGIYDTLSGTLVIAGQAVSVDFIKHFVTKDMFADFVKRVFDETDAWVEQRRDYLKKQIPVQIGRG